jgi:hypothetical protein
VSDLTTTEQANVRRALRFLRAKLGTWEGVAAALNTNWSTLKTARGKGAVSASLAFRVARVAGATIDDVVCGRYAPAGVCPYCGERIEVE